MNRGDGPKSAIDPLGLYIVGTLTGHGGVWFGTTVWGL
jgi:hypothetical protein